MKKQIENAKPELAPVELTRDTLISICEKSIVDVTKWESRDCSMSQELIGKLWALLKANCQFEILFEDGLCTNEETIWIRVWWPKFIHFDGVDFDLNNKEDLHSENFYLPTIFRLAQVNGSDWY